MADLAKLLGQSAPAATTETDLYTVPAVTNTTVSSVVVANRGSSATTFRISVADAGAATTNKDYLYFDISIPAFDTFIATIGATLEATDKIRVFAGNANLSFNAFGIEST
jgi:hypothetical protein